MGHDRRSSDGRISIEDHMGDMETRQTLVERHPRLAGLLTVLAGPLDTLLLGNSLVALAGAVAELAHLECRVVRRALADVQAEIGAVDEAISAAGTEARRVLRGTRPTRH